MQERSADRLTIKAFIGRRILSLLRLVLSVGVVGEGDARNSSPSSKTSSSVNKKSQSLEELASPLLLFGRVSSREIDEEDVFRFELEPDPFSSLPSRPSLLSGGGGGGGDFLSSIFLSIPTVEGVIVVVRNGTRECQGYTVISLCDVSDVMLRDDPFKGLAVTYK
jgi:hypothetical protein